MIQIDHPNFLNKFPKQIEIVSWVFVAIGLIVALLLPRSPEDRQAMNLMFLASAIFVLVYFHWLLPRVLKWPWVLYFPHVFMVAVLASFYYITEQRSEAEVILALLVAVAAIRTGRNMGFLVALMAGLAMTIVPLLKPMPTSPTLWISKAIVFIVYLFIAHLTSSVANDFGKQVKRMSVLNKLAHTISSTIEMDVLLPLIYQQLRQIIPTDTYYVGVHDPARDFIDMKVVYDEGELCPPQNIQLGKGLVSLVIQQREPRLFHQLSVEAASIPTAPQVVGHPKPSESWLGVPMLMSDGYTGVIAVASYKKNAFGNADIDFMSNIATQVGLALDNARHHAQVEDQARRDSLTGVFNHGYLWAQLRNEVEHARETDQPVTLIMLDIDHFKTYNDTYGHVVGDGVLRLIVQAIQAHVKQVDTAGRWGGEEFAIILSNTATDSAHLVAERIRETLQSLPLVDGAGQPIPKPTVSQDIATFPNHASEANKLVDLADATLYLAKKQGRDQVRLAETFRG